MKARKRVLVTFALIGPLITACAVAAISYVVYHQVSAEMVAKTQEVLHERLLLVDQTIMNVFLKAAHGANILLSGESFTAENRDRYVHGLTRLVADIPGCRRGWILLPDGTALYGPATNGRYLERNRWWQAYKSPALNRHVALSEARETASIIGKPFRDELNLDTIVPIIVYRFEGVECIASVFIETDITELLILHLRPFSAVLSHSDSQANISIYGRDGNLIDSTENIPVMKVQPLSPQTRLPLSQRDLKILHGDGWLSVVNHEYVELFGWDPSSGLIFDSRIPHSPIVSGVARITLRILGIGFFSLAVIVALGLLLVRALYRMKTFEEQQIRARLEMLQAKMDPHFLFNTLDSMASVVAKDDRDTLLRMLRSLSYMLHMSVRKKEDIITLAEELKYVTSYVELQRVRQADSFEFALEVDETLLDLYVYRFCLQPMVENCFVHAVAKLPSRPVCISLHIERGEGVIWATVSDNGHGCGPEIRRRLEESFTSDRGSLTNHVGLAAVHARLRNAYGRRFGLRLLWQTEGFGIQAALPVLRKPV